MKFPIQNYHPKIRNQQGKQELFDFIRKKYVRITPEELVRQHVLKFLVDEKKINAGKIAVEKEIDVNGLKKRFDVLVYDDNLKPLLLAECKAPHVKISLQVAEQIANYNFTLKAKFLLLTNGIDLFIAEIDFEKKSIKWFEDF
jgi:hypothetical protein